ncbi:low temperature requirement protein LtrA [Micromonospora pisi]|uniref:Low temperature requirement protein LtrA n=1 Tax=Micromonospora pisi TaxID=589240 RepID=A0A495JIE9_9ACTN|nr:low temperature requirement protein A [Micromonospora pisi]RKR88164.1 low temperature requirement protein LtrA [Micromonospora pisi]
MTSSPLPRILRKGDEPEYPTFLELFFDLVYIFLLSRIAGALANDPSVRNAVMMAVLLAAAWWVWVLTAWLTDLFNPQLPIIQATVLAVMLGALVMAITTPRAFGSAGWIFVAGYFGIHLARDLVLIPGTRVNRYIQARSVRVFFWFGVTGPLWVAGALVDGTARLVLWAVAVAVDLGSARVGWPTPRLGRTDLTSQIFTGTHLSERHREIFIIALGELILTTGLELSASGFEAGRVAASGVAFANAVLLFHLYFHRVRQLLAPAKVALVERVRSGTSTSYTHLVMVAGAVVISASDILVIGRPFGEAPASWIVLILGGPALFLVGGLLFDFVVTGRLLLSRAVALVVLGAIGPAVAPLPPLMIMILANLVLLLTLLVETLVRTRWLSGPAVPVP